jgi:hypothetical protein
MDMGIDLLLHTEKSLKSLNGKETINGEYCHLTTNRWINQIKVPAEGSRSINNIWKRMSKAEIGKKKSSVISLSFDWNAYRGRHPTTASTWLALCHGLCISLRSFMHKPRQSASRNGRRRLSKCSMVALTRARLRYDSQIRAILGANLKTKWILSLYLNQSEFPVRITLIFLENTNIKKYNRIARQAREENTCEDRLRRGKQ